MAKKVNLFDDGSKKGRGLYDRSQIGNYLDIFEKKITVDHYLNTNIRKKATSYNRPNTVIYSSPLYIKLAFNGKTTFIKSKIIQLFSEPEYEKAIQDKNIVWEAIYREKAFIEHLIKKAIKDSKLENPNLKDLDFKYSEIDNDIFKMVEISLIKKLNEKADNIKFRFEKSKEFDIKDLSALELLTLYNLKIKSFSDFLIEIPLETFLLKVYFKTLFENNASENTFHYWLLPPMVFDFQYGGLKEAILKSEKVSEIEKNNLIIGLNTLLKKIYEI